jgi:hypothetical protein
VTAIRQGSPALQTNRTLQFLPIDNEELLCYSKHSDDRSDVIVTVVNLDPHHKGPEKVPGTIINLKTRKTVPGTFSGRHGPGLTTGHVV